MVFGIIMSQLIVVNKSFKKPKNYLAFAPLKLIFVNNFFAS